MAIFLFASGVGPKDAQSNISHWLDLVGWQSAADATANLVIQPFVIWTCVVLLVLSFAPQVGRAIAATGWPAKKDRKPSSTEIARALASRADNIVKRLHFHKTSLVAAERLDPLMGVINDATSLMLTYEKSGFEVPDLSTLGTIESRAGAILEYFSSMAPLLRDGHMQEAREAAPHIAEQVTEL